MMRLYEDQWAEVWTAEAIAEELGIQPPASGEAFSIDGLRFAPCTYIGASDTVHGR